MQSRIVRFVGPRRVALELVEVPRLQSGEVLVRTLYSGISPGSEMLAYRGHLDSELDVDENLPGLQGTFEFPFSFGYSCVGVVEESRAEMPAGMLVFAFHPHQELFVAAAVDVEAMDGVDPRTATLFPLVETGLQIALDAGPVYGQSVIVAGLGPVGVLTCALLAMQGARVIGSDPLPWRRKTAEAFGAEALHPDDLGARVQTEGQGGVPLAIEASGNPEALDGLLPLLAHEGTALVASWYGDKTVGLKLGKEFHRRRLQIRSSQVSTIPAGLSGRWSRQKRRAEARHLLELLPLKHLTTHEFDFTDAPEAYAAIDRGIPEAGHIALRYSDRHA